jgi:hypothetical protein
MSWESGARWAGLAALAGLLASCAHASPKRAVLDPTSSVANVSWWRFFADGSEKHCIVYLSGSFSVHRTFLSRDQASISDGYTWDGTIFPAAEGALKAGPGVPAPDDADLAKEMGDTASKHRGKELIIIGPSTGSRVLYETDIAVPFRDTALQSLKRALTRVCGAA